MVSPRLGQPSSETSDCKRLSEGGPTVSLLEERATIDKRTVTTGKVSVVIHTETVEELVRAVLEGEELPSLLTRVHTRDRVLFAVPSQVRCALRHLLE